MLTLVLFNTKQSEENLPCCESLYKKSKHFNIARISPDDLSKISHDVSEARHFSISSDRQTHRSPYQQSKKFYLSTDSTHPPETTSISLPIPSSNQGLILVCKISLRKIHYQAIDTAIICKCSVL